MKPEYPLYALAAVALVAVAWLTGVHDAIPAELWAITIALITAAAGVTVPTTAAASAAVKTLQSDVASVISSVESLTAVVTDHHATPGAPATATATVTAGSPAPIAPPHLVSTTTVP